MVSIHKALSFSDALFEKTRFEFCFEAKRGGFAPSKLLCLLVLSVVSEWFAGGQDTLEFFEESVLKVARRSSFDVVVAGRSTYVSPPFLSRTFFPYSGEMFATESQIWKFFGVR